MAEYFEKDFKVQNGKGLKVEQYSKSMLRVTLFRMKNFKFQLPCLAHFYLPAEYIPRIANTDSIIQVIAMCDDYISQFPLHDVGETC